MVTSPESSRFTLFTVLEADLTVRLLSSPVGLNFSSVTSAVALLSVHTISPFAGSHVTAAWAAATPLTPKAAAMARVKPAFWDAFIVRLRRMFNALGTL